MEELLESVVIDEFIDKVLISKKRRNQYYRVEEITKLPKKYQTPEYGYSADGYIVHLETKKRIVKNPIAAGKPRYWTISGQDLWSGMDPHLRSKVGHAMKVYFYEKIKHFTPITNLNEYPIGVRIIIWDIDNGGDLDNMIYIYRKTIHDALCGNVEFVPITDGGKVKYKPDYDKFPPILIDDSKKYINDLHSKFVAINDHNRRKMIIQLYKTKIL